MVFNSLGYFLFLPLVFLLFTMVSDRHRWLVLLGASYIFYGFLLQPLLLLALTAVILMTFQLGLLLERSQHSGRRRLLLWSGITVNLGLLVYFKYLPFIVQNLSQGLIALGVTPALAAPAPLVSVGLSFYIFQAISYLADIYFNMAQAERHPGHFALYMAFFPKLLQGPIERAGHLIPQLKVPYRFSYDNIRFGVLLFALGLFKKVVIADRLGLYVDAVYGDVHDFRGVALLLATYAYAFQLYMDFSAYTDMALGAARLFNLNLTQNFNSPFLARSVADFWRRWHMSLSRWILDYVFEPLQMQFRKWGKWGTAAALMITFILVGIWHGANWTFIVFGLIHGMYLAISSIYKPYQKRLHRALGVDKSWLLKAWQIFVTFNLVSLTFVFVRAPDLPHAFHVLTNMFNGIKRAGSGFLFSQTTVDLVALGIFSTLLLIGRLCLPFFRDSLSRSPLLRWSFYYVLTFSIIFFTARSQESFIYFAF